MFIKHTTLNGIPELYIAGHVLYHSYNSQYEDGIDDADNNFNNIWLNKITQVISTEYHSLWYSVG